MSTTTIAARTHVAVTVEGLPEPAAIGVHAVLRDAGIHAELLRETSCDRAPSARCCVAVVVTDDQPIVSDLIAARTSASGIRVVAVTSRDPATALTAGAHSVVTLCAPPQVIAAAVTLTAAGYDVLPADAMCTPEAWSADARLDDAQRGLLEHLCTGRPLVAIAADVGVSERTIRTRARRLYTALGVTTRHEAVLAAAVRSGVRRVAPR